MTVGIFCNRDVITAPRSMPLVDVAQLMRLHHVGTVVVVDEDGPRRKPAGIITDLDIVVEVIAMGAPLDNLTAADVMSSPLISAREEDSLWDTLQRMRARGVRRVTVTDHDGVLAGVLSVDDMLELISGELSDLVSLTKREQQHEQAVREKP